MSALDSGFFFAESENTPMHVGSVAVFEGPAPTYGDVVRLLLSKLPLVPRYRQPVREVPMQLGRPVWVDAPHFQILYHVRHTAVPSPGSDEQLRNLAGRVLGQRLDMAKPLWELWLVEGLENGRWAIISKVHPILQRPLTLDVRFSCAAVRAAAATPDGVLLATIRPEAASAGSEGL